MQLTEKQLEIINADGHLLVTGGPGSGKTTVSLFKAAHIAARALHPGQKILFLSFARPTISRVIEAIEYEQQIPCVLLAYLKSTWLSDWAAAQTPHPPKTERGNCAFQNSKWLCRRV